MNRLYEYYEASGGSQVIDTSYVDVFHYDPSTFYNYEQDNLSVTSLESRFDHLKQFVGFPGSQEYSGVTLIVSSDVDENNGVYGTAQAAVDALPRKINYPVLIEIATYGAQEALSLVGIQCEGRGAIEIRSLNYASDNQAEASGIRVVGQFSSVSSVNSTTIQSDLLNASSTRSGDNTFDDAQWKDFGRAFAQRSPDSQKETQIISFACSGNGVQGGDYALSSADSTFVVEQYQQYYQDYDNSVADDPFPRSNDTSDPLLPLRQAPETGDTATAVLYGSHFSSITIRDCNRVKLTGVLVDGISESGVSATYSADTGLKVNNSDVLLEDFAVARCRTNGIIATNSKLSCAGSLIIYRIYEADNGALGDSRGTGVNLFNSKLVFDTSSVPYAGRHMRFVGDGADVGINCVNSLICGGTRDQEETTQYSKNAGGSDTITSHLQSSRNNLGFKLNNSVIDFDGRLGCFLNFSGIEADHSKISTPQFSVDDNQHYGFKLNSSDIFYGKHADFIGQFGGTSSNASGIQFFHCDYNGINVIAENNSNISIHPDVKLFSKVGSWGGNTPLDSSETDVSAYSFMRNGGMPGPQPAPAITLDSNSRAHIIGLAYTGNCLSSVRQGAAALVTRSSNLILQGFSDRWTAITSNDDIDAENELRYLYASTPFYAKGSSKISFIGPTKISRWGVDVLCEDNSESYFGPPTELLNGLDSVKYGLETPENHTKVELHSNRSCLVASKDSKIRMFGLGASADASSSYGPIIESNKFIGATSGGYMAFFPNAFSVITNGTAEDIATVLGDNLLRFRRDTGLVTDFSSQPEGSTGGMCVRAVDGSDVDVELVDFKFGMPASSVSGVMYNWNGLGTEFIDNMDNFGPPSFTTDTCWIADQCCVCPEDTTVTTTATTILTTTTTTAVPTTTTTKFPPATTLTTQPPTTIVTTIFTTTPTSTAPTTTLTTIFTSTTPTSTPPPTTLTTVPPTTTITIPTTLTSTTQPFTTTITSTQATTLTTPPPTTPPPTTPPTTVATTITIPTTITSTNPPTSTTPGTTTTTTPFITVAPPTLVTQEPFNFRDTGRGNSLAYGTDGNTLTADTYDLDTYGSRIHMWNISNDSRLRVFKVTLNNEDTRTESVNNSWHGPTGRWWNGAACDYYGKYGYATESKYSTSQFDNWGPFRLMVGGDGDLKILEETAFAVSANGVIILSELSSLEGGSPYDQVNAQGYMMPADYAYTLSDITYAQAVGEYNFEFQNAYSYTSAVPAFGRGLVGFYNQPGKVNGFMTHARMQEGQYSKWYEGELHPGFAIPPIRCDWEGFFNNRLDDSALSLFANAKHAASKKISLVSVHKTTDTTGGIGRDVDSGLTSFGVGVRSLNIFELNQLV